MDDPENEADVGVCFSGNRDVTSNQARRGLFLKAPNLVNNSLESYIKNALFIFFVCAVFRFVIIEKHEIEQNESKFAI